MSAANTWLVFTYREGEGVKHWVEGVFSSEARAREVAAAACERLGCLVSVCPLELDEEIPDRPVWPGVYFCHPGGVWADDQGRRIDLETWRPPGEGASP